MYADGKEVDAAATNKSRLAALQDQLSLYAERGISWSLWLWKGDCLRLEIMLILQMSDNKAWCT